jgi:tetratricopeptide (TPR) repeat protein
LFRGSWLIAFAKRNPLAAIVSGKQSSKSEPEGTLCGTALFALNGDYWTVGYQGETVSLKASKGLAYIHRLLGSPHEEFHALDLLSGGSGTEFIPESPADETSSTDSLLTVGRLGDAGEMLDGKAKQDYKLRLIELRENLEDARERGGSERAEEIQSEIDFLAREITRAVGLGGRDRRAGSAAERARLNVTRAIKAALQKISEHHKVLAEILERSIKTGSFCSYGPNRASSIEWQLSTEAEPRSIAVAATQPSLPRPDARFLALADQTKFVGREPERAMLLHLLDQAARGDECVAMIAGPAGVGKTRIATEIGAEASARGFLTLAGNCYERDDAVPFIPVVEILESFLARAPSPAALRLALGDDAAEIARLVPQLRRTFHDIPSPLEASPEQSRRVLFNAVAEFLVRSSSNTPLLLLLEDLHWADEGTMALITHVARAVCKLPVMIIGTFRDNELSSDGPLAQALDNFTRLHLLERINLRGLSPDAVSDMIRTLSGQEPSASLVHAIHSGTEGNPFFIEELYKHLKERGRLSDRSGALPRSIKLDALDVPENLRLVIGRRLAGLSDQTRKVLGTAAIVGRSFTFGLLEASTRTDTEVLLDCVEEAEGAGIISSTLEYPESLFRFSHELIGQTVVSEISAPRRQRLHLDVADAIERIYENALEEHAHDLAHHLWQAGPVSNAEKTLKYLAMAANQALAQSAYEAALRHVQNALTLLPKLPKSKERSRQELGLRIDHGVALLAIDGWYVPEVGDTYRRARELCQELGLGGDPSLFSVVFGLWMHHLVRGEHRDARYFAEECRQLASQLGDDKLTLYSLWALGCSQHFMGEMTAAHDTHDEAIRQRNSTRDTGLFTFGQDPLMSCLYYDAVTLWILGNLEQSRERELEAEKLAHKLQHPFTLAWYLVNDAMFCEVRRDYRGADARITEAIPICEENGFAHNLTIIRGLQGLSLGAQGKIHVPPSAVGSERGLAPIGHELFQPWVRGAMAEVIARQGNPSLALAVLDQALELVDRIGERFFEAELHRIKGEVILLEGEKETGDGGSGQERAEQSFRDAIAIAHRQEARTFQLRAATSLSRLQMKSGRKAEAREPLREVYNSFGTRIESIDLAEARNLLLALD